MKVQARELMRLAKRLNITPERGNCDCCVGGIMARAKGLNFNYNWDGVGAAYGLTYTEMAQLEAGFEGYQKHKGTRYYKIGANFARLAGLSEH